MSLLLFFIILSYAYLSNSWTPKQASENVQADAITFQRESQGFNTSGPITIYLGASVSDHEFYQLIASDLQSALPGSTITNDSVSLKNDSIVIGRPAINKITQQMVLSGNFSLNMTDWPINSYRISYLLYNQTNVIVISGNDNLGDGYGVYWFIEYLLKLHPEKLNGLNITRKTSLTYRRMSIGWGYQLHWSDTPPYVDQANVNLTFSNIRKQIRFALQRGANMLNLGSFLRFLTFDTLDPTDPYAIYAADSPYRPRHEKYVELYQNITNYFKKFNFTIITSTDMFPYTPPIKEYLGEKLDVNDPNLWRVINASIFELFTKLPFDGLQIRIGEGGEVGATNYTSAVIFRTISTTKQLIRELLTSIDAFNSQFNTSKFLIFRTWTIGIGEIGDLHIDPDLFQQVFAEFDNRSNLIVSIKHVAMDFQRYVPRNPTIGLGNLPVVIEFQSAREYEGYGNYPNYLAKAYQNDLQAFEKFSNFKGVWIWLGYAGWYKGANVSYGLYGFYAWQDANVYAYFRLNWNTSEDIEEITRDWVRLTLGDNSQVVANFTQMLLLSDFAVTKGLYIHDFAKYTLGLDLPFFSIGRLPTMLWIYWNIPTSGHAVLSVIYGRCRANLSANVQDGFIALNLVRNMSNLIQGFQPNVTNPELYATMLFSLKYMEEVYTMLAWYRQLFLCYYDWATTLNPSSKELYLAALPQVKTAIAQYMSHWNQYSNFSRYETYEMEDFIQRVEIEYPQILITSRIIFGVLMGFFLFGIVMSVYATRPDSRKHSIPINTFIQSAITLKHAVFNPRQFFRELSNNHPTPISFVPIFGMTLVAALAFTSINYFEYFSTLFFFTWGIFLLLWSYFSSMIYLFGLLFKNRVGFVQTFRYTQYFFLPIFIYSIVLFGINSIFGPEIVWYYLSRSLIYSTPLIIAFVLIGILLCWLAGLAIIGVKSLGVSWWKTITILIIPLLIFTFVIYYIIDTYFTEIFVQLIDYFDLINSVFGATQTGAAQFF
ncbi:MAG: YIP1 family protein [Candidatus Helarchaeota archaeon]